MFEDVRAGARTTDIPRLEPGNETDCLKTEDFTAVSVGAVREPPENRALLEAPLRANLPIHEIVRQFQQ